MKELILLAILTILGIIYTQKWTLPFIKEEYVPLFHVGDCFMYDHKDGREPDGIVTLVSDLEYTILWKKEADRRTLGKKEGGVVPIRWMDLYYHKVECPKPWVTHNRHTK